MTWSRARRLRYYKDYQQNLRRQAIKLLGGKCRRCGSLGPLENALELHHVVREPDSARSSYQAVREALQHPERFMLLCRVHHLDTHVRLLETTGSMDPNSGMDRKAVLSLMGRGGGLNLARARGQRQDALRRHWAGS